jgi:esterase/lipase superfamily enzyme
LVFIHGNRYEAGEAKGQGVLLARHCTAGCPGGARPRVVIFSWPSAQQGILLKDGRAKYERAYADGHYLAWFLGQVAPERPVAIVAYSFGALITLEALEDLVAAERSGRADILPWTRRPGRTHLVFVAPAVRCDALAPRGPYAETRACFDRLTLVINSRDDALKFFPWIDRDVRAAALGKVGMPRRWAEGAEFTATDAAGIVGKQHGLPLYLASPTLSRRIATGALDALAQ